MLEENVGFLPSLPRHALGPLSQRGIVVIEAVECKEDLIKSLGLPIPRDRSLNIIVYCNRVPLPPARTPFGA